MQPWPWTTHCRIIRQGVSQARSCCSSANCAVVSLCSNYANPGRANEISLGSKWTKWRRLASVISISDSDNVIGLSSHM